MRFYQKYLEKNEIFNRSKKYGFPNPKFVELLVYDFEIYRQLLQISNCSRWGKFSDEKKT